MSEVPAPSGARGKRGSATSRSAASAPEDSPGGTEVRRSARPGKPVPAGKSARSPKSAPAPKSAQSEKSAASAKGSQASGRRRSERHAGASRDVAVLKRSSDLQFLLATSEDLARSLALPDVLSTICRNLLGVVPASRVGILLKESDGSLRLAAGAVRGLADGDFPRGRRLDPAVYPEVARALMTGEPVEIPDVATNPLVAGSRSPLQALGIRSLLVMPLSAQDRKLGVLSIAQQRSDRPFTMRQRQLIHAVACQAAVALTNAQLYTELQGSARDLERKVEERTRSLRESHLRLAVLNEITTAINMSLDLDRILEAALTGLQRLASVDLAQVWLVPGEPPLELEAYQLDARGRLSATRRPLSEDDSDGWLLDLEGQPIRFQGEALEARSHLHAPLVSKERVVGALHVFAASPEPHPDADMELLQQVAGEISIALERSRLYRREMRRSRQFEAISDIGRQITRAVALEGLLPMAAGLIRSSFGYPLASVLLPDESGRELVVAGAAGVHPRVTEIVARHRQPIGMGLCGQAFLERRTINVPDVSKELRHAAYEGLATRSELVVPIVAGDEAIGVIDLQSDRPSAFTDEDVAVLETLADQLAAALKLARLIEDLQRESAFTEQIINNLTAGLVVTDSRRVVQVLNQRAAETLSIAPEEVIGRDLLAVLPSAAPLFEYRHEAIGRECEIEIRDGTIIPLGFSNSFFVDTIRRRNAVIITFRDLSDVRELQRKVRHAERLATIGSVAAGVAHEIRNPLFGISATSQILVRELPPGPLRQLTEDMLDEVRRLNDLVTSLVAYGRPQAQRLTEVEAGHLASEAVEAARARAEQVATTLEVTEEMPPARLLADADQLKQVILNLVLNAIEANPGGRVEVSTSLSRDSQNIVVRVRDHGRGIPPHELEKVFDLFFTTKPKGSGMGLAISSKIVQDHGGVITAANARGGGALFEVRLPVMPQGADS